MTDLVVNVAVKEQLADQNVLSDFYDALDSEVEELLAGPSVRRTTTGRLSSRATSDLRSLVTR